MRIPHVALILVVAVSTAAGQTAPGGQSPAGGGAAPQQDSALAQPATASSMLQPALAMAQNTLNALKLDRWKKGSVRDEAGDHVSTLLHDLQANFQPLIAASDAAPGSLSMWLPLTKHLDAFYDVMLRVEEASRVAAPGEQVTQLQQALQTLEQARIAIDNQMAARAAAQEKQVGDLQAALREEKAAAARAVPVAVTPPPCKPAAATAKKKAAKKPAATTPAGTKPNAGTPAATKPQ